MQWEGLIIKKTMKRVFVYVLVFILFFYPVESVHALDEEFRNENDIIYVVPPTADGGCSTDSSTTSEPGSLDAFLKALAKQESGGNPTAANPNSSARGKYQYITGTWQARWALYPPANKYSTADLAPEPIQDAVAYIEYAQKWKAFNGSIFKLAVSHFYPAANDNPALLDITPPGNSITPREYANAVVDKVNNGYGSEIPLKYSEAPDFQKYLDAATGGDNSFSGTASTSSADGCTTGGNIEEGGLTEDQAKIFVMNYGADKGGDSTKAVLAGPGTPSSGCAGGLLSNCTSFSAFFVNKFTSDKFQGGAGSEVVGNLGAAGVPTGNKPKVYSVFSTGSTSGDGHTGVILGIHGDTVIVGQASCSSTGSGAGDGTTYNKGAAIIRVGKINDGSAYFGTVPTKFAYPRNVDVDAIQEYINAAS